MSGRKSNLESYKTITAGDMSGTVTSLVTNIRFLDDIGYQFVWTGSPTGNIAIQVSADYDQDTSSPPNVLKAGNWVPLTFTYWNGSAFVTATSIPTSVASPVYIDLALLSAPWIRAQYTGTGVGSLTATITGKMI